MKNLHGTLGSAKGAAMSEAGRKKSRLNGFQSGSSFLVPGYEARIPSPPAKPGKYPECEDCQELEACTDEVDTARGTCLPVYCHRKLEVSLKYAAAFLSGDPEKLKLIAAKNAAEMQMVYNAAMNAIFKRGAEIVDSVVQKNKDGEVVKDPEGNPYVAQNIYAHPLIKQCISLAQTMGYTLGDSCMTPKSK
ncbi:MAG: hypothetical protein V3T30_05995, partial [Thermodesulfobacteriota bacterium]